MIQIGEIALFDIGTALRPFLVVGSLPDGSYCGELFFDYEHDRTPWVLANVKRPPHESIRSCWIKSVREGVEIGMIRPKVATISTPKPLPIARPIR